jgi:hypothetical protein
VGRACVVIEREPPANSALCNLTRAALRSAIAEWQAAKARHRHSERAEELGRLVHDAAEQVLLSFNDLEVCLVEHRVDEFKRAATGALIPNFGLPDGFAARRTMREEARMQVITAKTTHEGLIVELSRAESVMGQARRRVADAAVDVLVAEGAKQAAALTAAWNEVWRQYDRMRALANCRLSLAEGTVPVTLPQDIVVLMQSFAELDDRDFAEGCNNAADDAGNVWCCWFESLLTDAEAEATFDGIAVGDNAASPVDDRPVAAAAELIV